MSTPRLDIVIFGATGDVGRAAAKYVARMAPPSLRWAIAGRSAMKLEALLSSLSGENLPTVQIASCEDPSSLAIIARNTRVVLSAAGPYTELGEPILLACIEGGAHYADITGELDWVGCMMEKYGARAAEAGVCICSFCGYDCIPCELSYYMARKALPTSDAVVNVECVTSLKAAQGFLAPRGTMLTVCTKASAPLTFVRGWLKFVPTSEHFSAARSLVFWLLPWWSAHVGAFTVPHFMGWCNTPVVHRSAAASGVGGFRFQDRQLLPFSDRWWSLWGLLPMLGFYLSCLLLLPAISIALAFPPTGRFLARLIRSGGYSCDGAASAGVSCSTRAVATSGAVADVRFVCPGDAGIQCTALLFVETGLAMLAQAEARALPAGMHTPVTALGDALPLRLRAAGLELSVSRHAAGAAPSMGATPKAD